jgi:ssDNA thymidine ADP-ribosyltransferase, DarT
MPVPERIRILRLVHLESLPTLLSRRGLHAARHVPADGLPYRAIHDVEVQGARHDCSIPCGPGGRITDYVPFYFGPRTPMLFRLHTGQVRGYAEGQKRLVYLVADVDEVRTAGLPFVFSDGHGLAAFTRWFDEPRHLDEVDWKAVNARYWASDATDNDRQRRKQAEFLIHRFCPWEVIRGIVVVDAEMKTAAESLLARFPPELHRPVVPRPVELLRQILLTQSHPTLLPGASR